MISWLLLCQFRISRFYVTELLNIMILQYNSNRIEEGWKQTGFLPVLVGHNAA